MSPSKMKPPAPEQRKRMTSQDCLETSKNDFTKVNIFWGKKFISSVTNYCRHVINE